VISIHHVWRLIVWSYVFVCCVFVCFLCWYNTVAKSWLALGYSWQPGCPWGASNRRHASDRVCLLLVSQWPHPVIQLVTHTLKTRLRLLCNVRCALPSTRLRSILIRDTPWLASVRHDDGDARPMCLCSLYGHVSTVSFSRSGSQRIQNPRVGLVAPRTRTLLFRGHGGPAPVSHHNVGGPVEHLPTEKENLYRGCRFHFTTSSYAWGSW
jgi:hypothetical protein